MALDAGAGLAGVITREPSVLDLGFVAAESVVFRSGDFADSVGRSLLADDREPTRTPSAASGVRGSRGRVPLRTIGRELLSFATVRVSRLVGA